MSTLKKVVDSLIINRSSYRELTKDEKELNFFIINRYLSKKFPIFAQKMNIKSIDKSLALDIWFIHLGKEIKSGKINNSFFRWFWSKSKKKSNNLPPKDNYLLLNKLKINQSDLDFLYEFHKEELLEELKYFRKLEKQ